MIKPLSFSHLSSLSVDSTIDSFWVDLRFLRSTSVAIDERMGRMSRRSRFRWKLNPKKESQKFEINKYSSEKCVTLSKFPFVFKTFSSLHSAPKHRRRRGTTRSTNPRKTTSSITVKKMHSLNFGFQCNRRCYYSETGQKIQHWKLTKLWLTVHDKNNVRLSITRQEMQKSKSKRDLALGQYNRRLGAGAHAIFKRRTLH